MGSWLGLAFDVLCGRGGGLDVWSITSSGVNSMRLIVLFLREEKGFSYRSLRGKVASEVFAGN